MAEIGTQKYQEGICNFTEDDTSLPARLALIEQVEFFLYGGAWRALGCDDLSSSICEHFANFVKGTTFQLFESFLRKAYNPLFPLGTEEDGPGTLWGSANILVPGQLDIYRLELQRLGSSCSLDDIPEPPNVSLFVSR